MHLQQAVVFYVHSWFIQPTRCVTKTVQYTKTVLVLKLWNYGLPWLYNIRLIEIGVLVKTLPYHFKCFRWSVRYACYWIKVLCRQTRNGTCWFVNRTQLTTWWKVATVHNFVTECNKCSRTFLGSCTSGTNRFCMFQTVQSHTQIHSVNVHYQTVKEECICFY